MSPKVLGQQLMGNLMLSVPLLIILNQILDLLYTSINNFSVYI